MEFLGLLNGNMLMIVAFAAITLGGALINNGYLSKMLKARGKGKTATELAERVNAIENGFVPDLGDVLGRMDGKLDDMQERMAEMERRLNHADKSALMGVIHNPGIHAVDRLRAFNNYLKLGGNGLVAEYAIRELILPRREDWVRVVQESRMKICCGEYRERIAEIDGRLRSETA